MYLSIIPQFSIVFMLSNNLLSAFKVPYSVLCTNRIYLYRIDLFTRIIHPLVHVTNGKNTMQPHTNLGAFYKVIYNFNGMMQKSSKSSTVHLCAKHSCTLAYNAQHSTHTINIYIVAIIILWSNNANILPVSAHKCTPCSILYICIHFPLCVCVSVCVWCKWPFGCQRVFVRVCEHVARCERSSSIYILCPLLRN